MLDRIITNKPKIRKVDISTWGEFIITDLFTVAGTVTTKIEALQNYGDGDFPYVTTQSSNNGVAGLYDYWTEQGKVLVIDSAVAGFCSYQDNNFSASDHVEKLIPNFNINKYIGLFIAAVINLDQYRYNYGRKFNQRKIRKTKIKLPADKNGNPDWDFMEDYISSLIDYSKIETKIKKKELPIDSSDWQYFRIGTLFAIQKCKCNNAGNLKYGDEIYYVGAKKNDNGIMKKVVYDSGLVTKGNCIIFICDGHGSVGYSNYMDIDFIGSTTLSVGYHAKLNKYTGLFLTAVLDLERPKYSYGRKYRKFLPETKIKLPADKNGSPDWQYMENYIKSLPYSDKI